MKFKVGDKVRVKLNKGVGDTVYTITALTPCCGCRIKPDGVPKAAEQDFDTSLLVKA